jgi:hypothetical protein
MRDETEVRDRLANINIGIEKATNEWTKEHLRVRKSELEWLLEPADKERRNNGQDRGCKKGDEK